MLIDETEIPDNDNIALEGYNDAVLKIIYHFASDVEKVALAEFGRGNGKLISWFERFCCIDGGKTVVLEDWNQTIFQADKSLYKDEDVIEWNAFGGTALDEKFDFIYCSLPNQIPGLDPDMFQERLNGAFIHLKSMLNEDGILVTTDYNVLSIKQAVANIDMVTQGYINTGTPDHPEYYLCVIHNG